MKSWGVAFGSYDLDVRQPWEGVVSQDPTPLTWFLERPKGLNETLLESYFFTGGGGRVGEGVGFGRG